MSGEIFWCGTCGAVDEREMTIHGCCPRCGSEPVRVKPPDFPEPMPDGISKHWAGENRSELP